MSIDTMDCETWIGSTLIDRDDHKVGTIEAIYFDEDSGQPQWMAVKTGLFGNRHNFVPLAGAAIASDAITTQYDKAEIDGAPKIDPDEDLREEAVIELHGYYDLPYAVAPAGDQEVVVEREIILPLTDPDTQAQDDMLIATGHGSMVATASAEPMTQGEQDMLIATGRSAPPTAPDQHGEGGRPRRARSSALGRV